MKLNKDNVEYKVLPKFKGGEKEMRANMFFDGNVRILLNAKLVPGATIGLHTHEDSSEIIYVISGVGTVVGGKEEEILYPGDCHYCPKGEAHSLQNLGTEDLVFFAVVPTQK